MRLIDADQLGKRINEKIHALPARNLGAIYAAVNDTIAAAPTVGAISQSPADPAAESQEDRLAALARRAVAHFGALPQTIKAIEEFSELTHALCRDLVHQPDATESVVEEIVDCWIMLAQLTEIYCDRSADAWMQRKLDRLEQLLPADLITPTAPVEETPLPGDLITPTAPAGETTLPPDGEIR